MMIDMAVLVATGALIIWMWAVGIIAFWTGFEIDGFRPFGRGPSLLISLTWPVSMIVVTVLFIYRVVRGW